MQHTFLTENDSFGIVDPTFNAVCLNADGSPNTDPTLTDPANCTGAAAAESGFRSAAGVLRPDPDGAAAGVRRLPEFDQRSVHLQRPRGYQRAGPVSSRTRSR